MLNQESTEDYKKGYRDALQMIIDTAAEATEGRELFYIMQAASAGIDKAEMLIEFPWY